MTTCDAFGRLTWLNCGNYGNGIVHLVFQIVFTCFYDCIILKEPQSSHLESCFSYELFELVFVICNLNKNLIFLGHLNDATIFNTSDLGKALAESRIKFPERCKLPNTRDEKFPYFFLGHGIFGLKNYLFTPYARSSRLQYWEKIYNLRHAHARRVIECAFGALVSKW